MAKRKAPVASGGESTALDLSSEKDRGLLRQAMTRWPKRWRGLDEAKKQGFVEGLASANDAARKLVSSNDPDLSLKAAGAIASIVRTAVMMEGQIQTDEWNQDKNDRMDSGKPTEIIGGIDVQFG